MSTHYQETRHRADVEHERFIRRCNRITEQIGTTPHAMLTGEFRRLATERPCATTLQQQFLVRGVLTFVLGRLACTAAVHTYPDVSAAYFTLSTVGGHEDEWFVRFHRALDALDRAIKSRRMMGAGSTALDIRIQAALHFVEAHYFEPGLTLRAVAEHAGLSTYYLARTLKQRTGHGFSAHLRRFRVLAAQRLLNETVLSIKEIAAQAGYGTTRQMERDIKRLHGMAPTAFRQLSVRPAPPASEECSGS